MCWTANKKQLVNTVFSYHMCIELVCEAPHMIVNSFRQNLKDCYSTSASDGVADKRRLATTTTSNDFSQSL